MSGEDERQYRERKDAEINSRYEARESATREYMAGRLTGSGLTEQQKFASASAALIAEKVANGDYSLAATTERNRKAEREAAAYAIAKHERRAEKKKDPRTSAQRLADGLMRGRD
jgi:hypothetical protein